MANMNMIQALNSAMDIMLGRDPSVVLMGEDIGYFGGVFRVTEGLQRKYGEYRVIDTPIAEGGIVARGHRHEQSTACGRSRRFNSPTISIRASIKSSASWRVSATAAPVNSSPRSRSARPAAEASAAGRPIRRVPRAFSRM